MIYHYKDVNSNFGSIQILKRQYLTEIEPRWQVRLYYLIDEHLWYSQWSIQCKSVYAMQAPSDKQNNSGQGLQSYPLSQYYNSMKKLMKTDQKRYRMLKRLA